MSEPNGNENAPQRRKRDSARRIRNANIGKLKRRCLTVLAREVERLMDESFRGRLEPPDGKLLLDYLKYIVELNALEDLEKLEGK